MDVTNIAGSSNAGDAVMSLISVLRDPVAYQAKLDELTKSSAENLALINLAGPANEIVVIRAEIDAKLAEADKALQDAKDAAAKIITEAEAKADAYATKTIDEANRQKAEANGIVTEALTKLKQATLESQAADIMKDKLAVLQNHLTKKVEEAEAAQEAAKEAEQNAKETRQAVIAKQEHFAAQIGKFIAEL